MNLRALSAQFWEWYGEDIEKLEALKLLDYELATLRSENARLRGLLWQLAKSPCSHCCPHCPWCSAEMQWGTKANDYEDRLIHDSKCPAFTEDGKVR